MTQPAETPQPDIKLSVLLPVRNEGINLRIMVKILSAAVDVSHEILVIHDEPGDDSIAVVEEMIPQFPTLKLVHNRLGRGVINAIRSGVDAASGDFILIFAADEVGPVVAIEDMLYLMDTGCDFVSCTRYAHGGRRLGGSLTGGFLSRLANRLFCFLTGSHFTDLTTGIKMFRRDCFNRFELQSQPVGWAVAFELAIKAELMGLKLGEVPIVSIDRLYGGKSTFRLGPWFTEYMRWFWWGLGRVRRSNHKTAVIVRKPSFLRE